MKEEPVSPEEIKRYFEGIEMEKTEVTSIKTPLLLPTFAGLLKEILVSHAISIEEIKPTATSTGYCLFTFPAKTYKQEVLPRTLDERYKIVLPDGFELREIKRRGEDCSYLQINKSKIDPKDR